MKVVHLCLGCFFPDNYSYQENMLPKFHKQLGYDVEVIASLVTFDKDGRGTYMEKGCVYLNEYQIPVTRLDYRHPVKIYRKLKRYVGTMEALEKAKPDVLFIHGCQFRDMDVVVKYLKNHPQVRVCVDNHADFSNSATNWLSKNILHKMLWRHSAHLVEPYTTKFYGVLPARVDFLKNVYKLPAEKCELLVMGADDEKVSAKVGEELRAKLRKRLNIEIDDRVIVTGGKINHYRTEMIDLFKAVAKLNDPHIKIVFFGTVTKELRDEFEEACRHPSLINVGWIPSDEAYSYFNMADIAVFPSLHSVLWEQAVGTGIPCLFRKMDGFGHIDFGGNCLLMDDVSVDGLYGCLLESLQPVVLDQMKKRAKEVMHQFSYKEIAKKSIEQ